MKVPRWLAPVGYVVLLVAFWAVARRFGATQAFENLASVVAAFALLLAPVWFCGFGAAEWLAVRLNGARARVVAAAVLVLPYVVFAAPRGELHLRLALEMLLFALVLAFLRASVKTPQLAWQDVVILAAVAAVQILNLLHAAWPSPPLGSFQKLWLMDVILYLYLVVRPLDGVGYDLRPRWRDLGVGLREWAFFAPFGIGIGLALHFAHFHRVLHTPFEFGGACLITFFLVALPEELFFRGVLQNLLGTRLGPRWSLMLASILFGFSHFNKQARFNWRYVLLASIAGFFYGRAWRDRRRLFASTITHTSVDVIWSLWFR
jgi:CAAX protease family protein